MISTQLVALLPPSATELPISHVTQIAALFSLGLVYQGTGHRHMAGKGGLIKKPSGTIRKIRCLRRRSIQQYCTV